MNWDDDVICEVCGKKFDMSDARERGLRLIDIYEEHIHKCWKARIVELEAENAKLEKLNSAALERLSYHACPSNRNNYGQPCNDSDDCVACWREYLGARLRLMCSAPLEEQ